MSIGEKTTTLRLRRVRFKNGKTIEVLRTADYSAEDRLLKSAKKAVECNPAPIAGYALVAWRGDGEIFVDYDSSKFSPLAAGQIPLYVKDVLLTEVSIRWSRND